MPTWLNNCPGGGSVKYLQVSIEPTWSGGDYGDDLVYGKAYLGQNDSVQAQGECFNGSKAVSMTPAVDVTIHPTRQGQTWWIGPGATGLGATTHN